MWIFKKWIKSKVDKEVDKTLLKEYQQIYKDFEKDIRKIYTQTTNEYNKKVTQNNTLTLSAAQKRFNEEHKALFMMHLDQLIVKVRRA